MSVSMMRGGLLGLKSRTSIPRSTRVAPTAAVASPRVVPAKHARSLSFSAGAMSARPLKQTAFVRTTLRSRRPVTVKANAPAPVAPPAAPKGANMKNLGISVACGLVLWFIPPPAGVAVQAWKLLSIFVGTIVGIITMVRPERMRSNRHPPCAALLVTFDTDYLRHRC
eukprot:1180396-Prorocentrum_minimum.AAC.1